MVCERCGKKKLPNAFPCRKKVCSKVCRVCLAAEVRLKLRKDLRSHVKISEKTCGHCLKTRPPYEFPLDVYSVDELGPYCCGCVRKLRRLAEKQTQGEPQHKAHEEADVQGAFARMYPKTAKLVTYYRTTFTANGLTVQGNEAHVCPDCTVLKLDRLAQVEVVSWKVGTRLLLCKHCGKAPVRLCSRCRKPKQVVDFRSDPNNDDGLQKSCRRCEDSYVNNL